MERKNFPIPRGNSVYAQAKRAEYVDKDLKEARRLYLEAIEVGDRAESALKDLASLLHQGGETQEACELLQSHVDDFSDKKKVRNLLSNLEEKLVPSWNSLNKTIKIWPLVDNEAEASIRRLFKDPSRIEQIQIFGEFALVVFPSHSAARKTLATFHKWNQLNLHWVNTDGIVTGPAATFKHRAKEKLKKETEMMLIGKDLFAELTQEPEFNVTAQPFFPKNCR